MIWQLFGQLIQNHQWKFLGSWGDKTEMEDYMDQNQAKYVEYYIILDEE